jgi:ribosome biogenesis protein ENP2
LVPAVPSTTFDDDEAKVPEVTALKFRHDGLSMAVGTSTGHTLLYDLRQSQPWLIKDQQYGLPIRSLHWHEGTTVAADAYDADGTALESAGAAKVISADAKIIKIWDRQTVMYFT